MIWRFVDYVRANSNKWQFWAKTAGILSVVGVIALFATFEITSQPVFCSSCHYMKPYYKQWKTSSHNKVHCLTCHAKPGITNYLRRKMEAVHEVVSMMVGKYPPRPHAQVDDAVCLRPGCHQTRLLSGTVTFKKKVIFDHAPHLNQERKGKQLRCTSCHAQMVMGSHIAVTEDVCFLCHFKSVASGVDTLSAEVCMKCHKVPEGALTITGTKLTYDHADYVKDNVSCIDCHSGVISGTGEVPRIMCMQCHNTQGIYARFDDHEFMHENHVTKHKVECYRCHAEIKHTLRAAEISAERQTATRSLSCVQCHSAGHSAAELLYKGEGGRGVKGSPSTMYLAQVNCTGCHRDRTGDPSIGYPTMRRAGPEGCVACHDADGAGYLQDWKSQVAASLKTAEAELARVQKISSIGSIPDAKKLLDDARHNIAFVKAANGVHNVEYAVEILDQSASMLNEAATLAAGRK
jgi:nitrate/TMAO reductase-like tetraheme cytochrome c subunit